MSLPQWELVLRLLLASGLGSIIGLERERLAWTAGLRTHMLVAVGSCLIIIVSAYGFNTTLGPHVVLDPSRIAAQVVSGIGFLGAGSIILRNEAIKGLTTAASIWAVAGIGLAAGAGLYTAAVASTLIILVILAGLKPLEERYRAARRGVTLQLLCRHGALSVGMLEQVLGDRTNRISRLTIEPHEDDGHDRVLIMFSRIAQKDIVTVVKTLRQHAAIDVVEELETK